MGDHNNWNVGFETFFSIHSFSNLFRNSRHQPKNELGSVSASRNSIQSPRETKKENSIHLLHGKPASLIRWRFLGSASAKPRQTEAAKIARRSTVLRFVIASGRLYRVRARFNEANLTTGESDYVIIQTMTRNREHRRNPRSAIATRTSVATPRDLSYDHGIWSLKSDEFCNLGIFL